VEWVVSEGVGAGGEMTQALYAHVNNNNKKVRVPAFQVQSPELKPQFHQKKK
jgi:hypothetical protein